MISFIKKLFGLDKPEPVVPNYLSGAKEETAPKAKRTATRKTKAAPKTATKKTTKKSTPKKQQEKTWKVKA
jgi:hypothetical protein